jgi:sensor histidine kinase YesM
MEAFTAKRIKVGENKPVALSERIRAIFTVGFVLKCYFYTFIISTFIAVFLTLIRPHVLASTRPEISFPVYFCVSISHGFIYSSIIMFLIWLVKPDKIINLILLYLIGICLGIIIGYQAKILILQYVFSYTATKTLSYFLVDIANGFVFGGGVSYFFYAQIRLKISKAIIEEERIKVLSSEKEILTANLKMLQAQIEPHFLFNTLSNILSLIDTEPAKSKTMLLDLTKYLRTSLSRTLPKNTTLDQELEIISAYLNIQKIRMGDRLSFRLEIDDALRQYSFPPMLLQPLVENAIKHGLEPKIEGGAILIRATGADNLLRIEISDTGVGFSRGNDAGVGIRNVQERIKLIYGDSGRLIMEENKPAGLKAIIEVPREMSEHAI